MEKLRSFIESYSEVLEEDWAEIQSSFSKKIVRKNEIILSEGEVCKHLYFIESGLFRTFMLNDGKEITKFFTAAPNLLTSQYSFRNQITAIESIQALEDSVLWETDHKSVTRLLGLKTWNDFTRNFLYEVQQLTEELMMEIKTETAENRYLLLMKRFPDEFKKIPLRHLSSFLGVAPQSLSRIRKKIK